ncbi:hypothetical protein U1Q18_036263 [Sarracenia purpurea var. burkii]
MDHQDLHIIGKERLLKDRIHAQRRNDWARNLSVLLPNRMLPKPLENVIPGYQNSNLVQVNQLLDEAGGWDIDIVNDNFPAHIANTITSIHVPRFSESPDFPHWKGSSSGGFSSAAACDIITDQEGITTNWKWLWKLKIPQKRKGFCYGGHEPSVKGGCKKAEEVCVAIRNRKWYREDLEKQKQKSF